MNEITLELLRKKVKESGLSQVELADRLSMTPSHISRMLSGERDTTLENLIAMADVLRVDRTYLLRLAAGLPPEPEEDPWVEETTHNIKLISPNLRGIVTTFVNSILDDSEKRKTTTKRKSSTV